MKWIKLSVVLISGVNAGDFCVITEHRTLCHYYSLDACIRDAKQMDGLCQAQQKERPPLPKMGRIEPQPDNFSYDPSEEARKIQSAKDESNALKQQTQQAQVNYRLDLYEKSAQWERDYPGQENPYMKELSRIQKHSEAQQEAKKIEFLASVCILAVGLVVLLIAAQ